MQEGHGDEIKNHEDKYMAAKERLNQLLENFVAAGIPGCALAVSYKGRIVYTGYRGMARLEDGRNVNEDTVYRLMSCTKCVTAVAVMRLYEEGRILLSDPLEHYLPFFQGIR